MTILYPEAFNKALPADFSGQFHWEYINDVLRQRRNIRLMDIDAICEINGQFASWETSDVDKENARGFGGQQRTFDALLQTGRFTHFDVIGKQIPTKFRLSTRKARGSWKSDADCRQQIADLVGRWAEWADTRKREDRDYADLRAAWDNALPAAKLRLIDEEVRRDAPAALAGHRDLPLMRAAFDRVKEDLGHQTDFPHEVAPKPNGHASDFDDLDGIEW